MRNLKTGVLLAVVSLIAAFCKKSSYVEANELGVIDTVLQLGIVFCIAIFIVLFAEALVGRFRVLRKALLKLGAFSYEVYLVHSLYLDILRNADSRGSGRLIAVFVFIALTAITTIALKCLLSLSESKGNKRF